MSAQSTRFTQNQRYQLERLEHDMKRGKLSQRKAIKLAERVRTEHLTVYQANNNRLNDRREKLLAVLEHVNALNAPKLNTKRNADDVIGHVTLPEFALLFGITTTSAKQWIAHQSKPKLHLFSLKNTNVTSLSSVLRYKARMQENGIGFRTRKPPGWLSTKQAAAEIGVHVTLVQRLVRERALQVVYVPRLTTYFLHPDDVIMLCDEYAATAPPGWVRVATINERGAAKNRYTFAAYLTRHEAEIRHYRHPETKRLERYCAAEFAHAWLSRRGIT